MKRITLFFLLCCLLLTAQSNFYQYRILNPIGGAKVTGNTGFKRTIGLSASYASITWGVSGTLAACTVQVDFSNDGSTVAGQLVAAQTCTSSGTFTAGSTTTPNYVRVSYIIGSGGGTLSFTAYGCNNSTCQGSGGGSVSTFSAGNLSPIFTTTVNTPTTTPSLSFFLTSAAANTIFGNFTGSSAGPIYNSVSACGDGTHALGWTAGTGFICQAITVGTGNITGSLTANKITKGTGLHTVGDSSGWDDGTNPVALNNGVAFGTNGGASIDRCNDGTTGTVANKFVVKSTTPGCVVVAPTSTTIGIQGVAVSGVTSAGVATAPGTTGNTSICNNENCSVITDNTTVIGHIGIPSTTVAGDIHDTGGTTPNPTTDNFLILSVATAGNPAQVEINTPDWFANNSAAKVYQIQANGGTVFTAGDKINVNGTTPAAGSNGKNITVQTSKSGTTDSVSLELVGNGTATQYLDGTGAYSTPAGTGVTTSSPLSGTTALSCPTCTVTVASGTSAMGTSAISSGTCATVVTTSATGTATTDVIIATPNADPTGVTGYAVASGGSLYIQAYPSSNNVNFKVCNPTSGSLTPSALTLNWRVVR